MRLWTRTAVSVVLALSALATTTAARANDRMERQGSCSSGGDWRLRVEHRDANTLRVRFRIEDTPAGDVWELFLSDNGVRFFAGTRTADSNGEVRVSRTTRDRAGTDRIKAYGYSRGTGETCSGSVAFDR
jgi:hypothetical protein